MPGQQAVFFPACDGQTGQPQSPLAPAEPSRTGPSVGVTLSHQVLIGCLTRRISRASDGCSAGIGAADRRAALQEIRYRSLSCSQPARSTAPRTGAGRQSWKHGEERDRNHRPELQSIPRAAAMLACSETGNACSTFSELWARGSEHVKESVLSLL